MEPKAVPPRFNRCPCGPLVSFVGCRLSRQPAETAEPVKQSPEQTAQPLPRGGLSLSLSLLPGLSQAIPLAPLLSRRSPCCLVFWGSLWLSVSVVVRLLALWVPCKDRTASLSRRVHRGESDTRHKAYRCRTMHRGAQQTGRWNVVCCYCSPFRAGSPEATATTGGTGKSRNVKDSAALSARALHCRCAARPLGHQQYSTPHHATTCDSRRNDATPRPPNNTAMGPQMGKPLFNRTRFFKTVVLHLCTCYTQCWRPPCESVCL